MRITLLLLALVAGSALASQTVWKWVDDKGVTHFSDRAVPGATPVQISGSKSSSSSNSAASPATSSVAPEAAAGEAESQYSEFTIWQPSESETIANSGGAVTVSIRLQPVLQAGHSLFLYMDGRLVEGFPENALSFDLQEVPRGTHTVIAVINGSGSKRIQESAPVTFYVRQESVAQPPVGPSQRPLPKPRGNTSAKLPSAQPTYAALNGAKPVVDPTTNRPVVPKTKPQPVTNPKGP